MTEDKSYDVCVIGGCGHVGLALSICFAKEGKKVVVVDVSDDAIAMVKAGNMPFREENSDELLKQVLSSGNLTVEKSPEFISKSESIIFVIGTPVSAHLYPTFSDFFGNFQNYLPYFRNGQLLILRSTVFPGSTEKIAKMLHDHGLKLDLALCPERIAEGYALRELYELPQIISSFSPEGFKRAHKLFSLFTQDIIELSPLEAELAKLFTNTWRYIRFAISNQFFIIANNHGLDFYKIHQAMTYKYPRTKDMPKAGFAAGPCLFKDAMQLASFSDNTFFLAHAAMLLNEGMPSYIVTCLKKQYKLGDLAVAILGMAFKAESDDPRGSLSFKLKNILEKEFKEVLLTDPYVKDKRLKPLFEVIEKSDILILATPHKVYGKTDFQNKPVIDIWNFYGKGGLI